MNKILKLLEKDSSLTNAQIASMLGMEEGEVAKEIEQYIKDGVILGHRTIINWELTDEEIVTALIEVKVAPQRGEGFDRVAARIYQFEEVESLYLMSGGYDLSLILAGKTMKEVALFVAQKLAPIEGVTGTATHFILKKYKDNGIIFKVQSEEQERAYIL